MTVGMHLTKVRLMLLWTHQLFTLALSPELVHSSTTEMTAEGDDISSGTLGAMHTYLDRIARNTID